MTDTQTEFRVGSLLIVHPIIAVMTAAALFAGPGPGASPGPGRAGPDSTAMQRRDSGPCCRHLLQKMGGETGPAPAGSSAGQDHEKERRR
jgi:hypothetical protein